VTPFFTTYISENPEIFAPAQRVLREAKTFNVIFVLFVFPVFLDARRGTQLRATGKREPSFASPAQIGQFLYLLFSCPGVLSFFLHGLVRPFPAF
jgi:hypothetical protein